VVTVARLQRDTAVTSLRVVDRDGVVLYRRNYHLDSREGNLEWHEVQVSKLKTSEGTALMLDDEAYPSAPMTGSAREILAWKADQLRPLSPRVGGYGDFAPLPTGDTPHTFRLLAGDRMPFRAWVMYFAVDVSLEIRLSAFGAADDEPLRLVSQVDPQSGLLILSVLDLVLTRPLDREDAREVTLYQSPVGSGAQRVRVRKTSEIEYGPAYGRVRLVPDPQFGLLIEVKIARLRVTIDGTSGFVEESDFSAVGLGVAG